MIDKNSPHSSGGGLIVFHVAGEEGERQIMHVGNHQILTFKLVNTHFLQALKNFCKQLSGGLLSKTTKCSSYAAFLLAGTISRCLPIDALDMTFLFFCQ